jgi:hypothetical protein
MTSVAHRKIVRMSNGRYCLIRDLGLVKGGKGLRHHELLLELSWRGLWQFAVAKVRQPRVRPSHLERHGVAALSVKGAPRRDTVISTVE